MSSSPFWDRPCAICSSPNHGTGGHDRLVRAHRNRLQELVPELELAARIGPVDGLEKLELEKKALELGLKRMKALESSAAPEGS